MVILQKFNSKESFFHLLLGVVIILSVIFSNDLVIRKTTLNHTGWLVLKGEAEQKYTSGDFEGAARKFADALELEPGDPHLLAGVIGSIAAEGSREGRESDFQKSAQKYLKKAEKSPDKEVMTVLGYFAETNGRYKDAADYYDRVIEKDPSDALAWFHKAHNLEFMGKKDESDKAYEKAFELSDDEPAMLLSRGRRAYLAGNVDEAYRLFMKMLEGNPSSRQKVEALTNASAIQRNRGYIKEALNLSLEAVSTDRKYGPALSNQGLNLVATGKYHKGIQFLKEAMQANARSAQPYWWIGTALRSGKDFDEAIKFQLMGLEMVENDNTLVGPHAVSSAKLLMTYDLARTYAMANRNEEALRMLDEAIQMDERVKIRLKNDVSKTGFFRGLSNDPQFQSYLK